MLLAPAPAATLDWITPEGGSFEEPKNWSFAFVPRSIDTAQFGYRDGAYTVRIDALATIDSLNVYRGDVAFALLGQTLSLLRADLAQPPGALIADGPGETAALSLTGFGRLVGEDIAMARGAGASGALRILNGARATATRSLIIGGAGYGDVLVDGSSRLAAPVITLAAGSLLGGAGVVAGAVAGAGSISPGMPAEIGTLMVQGSAAFAPTSELRIDLAPGLTAGAPPRADRLALTGPVTLDGTLQVSFLAGYAPTLGDSFTIVSASSLAGGFDSLAAPALGGGLAFALAYGPTGATLTVVPDPGAALLLAALGGYGAGARRRR